VGSSGCSAGWTTPGSEFFSDGAAALAALEQRPADVVATDVQMSGLDGGRRLARVQERHPDVVRLALSGDPDAAIVFRAVPHAHQFLAKPFELAPLRAVLERACALRSLLTNASVRELVGRGNDLPAAPGTYVALTQVLRDPQGLRGLARRDRGARRRGGGPRAPALEHRVVRHGAAGGQRPGRDLPPRRRDPADAGAGHRARAGVHPAPGPSARAFERVQVVALQTARLARAFLAGTPEADDAFVAGLLHPVGQLVLGARATDRYASVLGESTRDRRPLLDVERERLGVTHADVGAYLLGLWGIRQSGLEAVAYHARPDRLDRALGVATAVHLGRVLGADPKAAEGELPETSPTRVPALHLARIGALGELPRFREVARAARQDAA